MPASPVGALETALSMLNRLSTSLWYSSASTASRGLPVKRSVWRSRSLVAGGRMGRSMRAWLTVRLAYWGKICCSRACVAVSTCLDTRCVSVMAFSMMNSPMDTSSLISAAAFSVMARPSFPTARCTDLMTRPVRNSAGLSSVVAVMARPTIVTFSLVSCSPLASFAKVKVTGDDGNASPCVLNDSVLLAVSTSVSARSSALTLPENSFSMPGVDSSMYLMASSAPSGSRSSLEELICSTTPDARRRHRA
mmetsp:Transcript_30992/g.76859  ORF Transcript_30992/g.76859 Transcript_30992/m.76859 type:complete len:250 (+) Transcript_30992:85-834(+)